MIKAEASGGDFGDGARLGAISSGVGFVANQTLTEEDSFTNKTLRTFTRGMKNIVSQIIKSDFGSTAGKVFSRGTTAIKTVFDVGGTLQDSNLSTGEKVAVSALQVSGAVATSIAGFKGGADGLLLGTPFGPQGAAIGSVTLGTLYGAATAEAFRQYGIEPLKNYFYNN